MTTNALGLARTAQRAAPTAGLDRVNVSLDTVRPETFHEHHPPRPARTTCVAGLEAAAAAGLGPVKVNAVLLRGVNDDQAPELLRWCLERGYELRFIEQMPLDAQHGWSRDDDGHRRRDLRRAARASSRSTPGRASRGAARPAELFARRRRPGTRSA